MDYNFFCKNLNCCSLELCWKNCDKEKKENDSYDYEILQREKGCEYIQIYFGKDRFCEAINLIPNKEYIFKLNIKKDGERILKKKLNIITSNSPLAILSINSFKIANKEKIENNNFILSESQKNIINICSKLISEQNEDDIMIGNFNGIEIRIAYVKENDINLCYISFDIKPDYFNQFFLDLINECEDNVISPCHFILKKLSTILIFNLLEKGPVIFTGKRMGGIIASSLAFYILYKGKLMNKNYGNSFIKKEKNCIGVVTFGSPSFLTNLTAGFKMKEFTPYFYNIKHEFDYIPVIIDYLDKNTKYNELINIFQKNELAKEDIKKLNYYLSEYNFIDYMTKTNKIPFGYYFLKKASDNTLIYQNEKNFYDFYYLKDIHQNKIISFLNIYKNLSFNIKFNSESLQFLEDKNYQIEFIKIIRRNNNIKNKSSDSMKGIIKIKIKEFENNYFTPDIISKIKLISNNTNYIINNKDIYYDNEYITAYIDNLNENINKVFIFNYFGGEMKVKNIINIMGSGSTREMLKNNIEKLFLFPFFKLIEIYYVSLNNEEKCNKLKKQNFGDNFNDLKFLKQFEKQIKTVDELLFLSRPDILGKNEEELINEFIGDELSNEQKKLFNNNLQSYYISALKLQLKQKINCLNSAKDTIAQETSFPYKFKDDVETKKLFMCEMTDLKNDLFNSEKIDDLYIKNFFIEQLIKRTLDCIDELIKKDLRDKDDNECKAYLDTSLGKLYNEHVLPNINFILFLILSSFEGGDEIIFNHNIDETKISFMILYPFIWLKPLGESRATFEKDFEKHFSKNEIEEINMRNLFYKTKIRNFVDSNISPQNKNIKNKKSEKIKIFEIISTEQNKNKINDFCKYSENRIFGKGFYKSFLKLLNYNSNFFQEDIEISIYDNLKKENNNSIDNYKTIIEIMNNLIDDEESKKGFLALVRQSYLLGKLRAFIVSIFILFFLIIIGRRIYHWCIWEKEIGKINIY